MATRTVSARWRRRPRGDRSGPTSRLVPDQRLMAGRAQPPSQLGDGMEIGIARDDAPTPPALPVPDRRSLVGRLGTGVGVLGHDCSLRGGPAIVDGRPAAVSEY